MRPANSKSQRQESRDQRVSAFERLGPEASTNQDNRNTKERTRAEPRRERSRAIAPSAPKNYSYSRHIDSGWEGGAESEFREARKPDRFPCFTDRLLSVRLPHKFKPSNHAKYDGKSEPTQWLRIYSQSIELVGGDDDIKALFFPMALEAIPLQWFDKLKPRSIRSWNDLQRAFCKNFSGIIAHPVTQGEWKSLMQKRGESLRDYSKQFRELRA